MLVDVVIPNRGWVRREILGTVIGLHRAAEEKGIVLRVFAPQGEPIDHLRNSAAAQAVEDAVEYLLFIDADNPPIEPGAVLDFAGKDLDIVVFPTPMWIDSHVDDGRVPIAWNIFEDDTASGQWTGRWPQKEVEEVGAGGTGCMLVHRRVFGLVKPAFMRSSDEWGRVVHGSDLLFCRRARAAGFTVTCAWNVPCRHVKEVDLFRVFESFHARDVSAINGPNINTPEYWDAQWRIREPRVLRVHQLIADLSLSAGPRVLDFGCGCGDVLRLLGPRAEGVDISAEAVRRSRTIGLVAHKIAPELPGMRDQDHAACGEKWDAIVISSVLEHLDAPASLVGDLKPLARRLVVSVPHNRLPPGLEPEHRRVYTRASLGALLGPQAAIIECDGYLVGLLDAEPAVVNV